MKKKEAKKLTKEQALKDLDKFKKDLFNFRFQKVNGQLTNPSKINETKYGIVIKNSIKVITEPSENSSTAFLLHEGSKAKVTAEINEWIEISFNEKKGWIRTNALERI